MKVGVIMGSTSDWEVMSAAVATLEEFGIPYEKRVVSAHRTPQLLCEYATTARERGLDVIIAGAGGAAHLPGMTAAMTPLPVIGVPVQTRALKGVDSLLSIVQMPAGVRWRRSQSTAHAMPAPYRGFDSRTARRGGRTTSGRFPRRADGESTGCRTVIADV